jgi:flavorubredoxin
MSMTQITEIGQDVFRISVYVEQFDLQFNQFLVRDAEPLLFHTGMRRMFPLLRDAVSKVIDPRDLRWISWSHFEVDECGSLNDWLKVAPTAEPTCGVVGALVNLTDFSDRPPRALEKGEVLTTGKYRFRFQPTPHLPHGWDAGLLFEETQRILFCSDLFHHTGEVAPVTESEDILERTARAIREQQAGPLMDYLPYTARTKPLLEELAALEPRTLAIMHGSSFSGNCGRLLLDLDGVLEDVFGGG